MSSPKQTLKGCWQTWLLSTLALIHLAWQCNAPPSPSLPTPPAGPVVRIALLSPSTGEIATFGRVMRNGAIMAFDEWNGRGGILGRQIEWVVFDTRCEFEAARQATQQAITNGFTFIIGPICSEAAIAAAVVAESEQTLLISPTATHQLVTVNGQGQTRPTIFRASYVSSLQGQAMARFAYDTLKVRKAALFSNPGDDYTTRLTMTFARQFVAEGGQIVYQATYAATDRDFADRLMAIGQAEAEIIYLPASAPIVNQVAHQLNELGLSEPSPSNRTGLILLGSDSWESTGLGLAAAVGSYFPVHFVLADELPRVQPWAQAYKSTYAVEPDTLAVLGYDAASILIAAIQQAGTFETMMVVEALERGTFESVTGQITFDSHHNPLKPVPIVRINPEGATFFTLVSLP